MESCQSLAKALGVTLLDRKKVSKPKARTVDFDSELINECCQSLLEDEQAAPLRDFLTLRKLWNPLAIERYKLGAFNGQIVFPQHYSDGRLKPRVRLYNPGAIDKSPWLFSKSTTAVTSSLNFWPYHGKEKLKEKDIILLCEGEWDALSAIVRLELPNAGYVVSTWTGGAGSAIPGNAIPEQWHGHEVWIVYDNDTFQGPKEEDHRSPDTRRHTEMMRRRKNLIDGVARQFHSVKCDVKLLSVPIDPLVKWGGDLRDWVNEHGDDADITTIPRYSLGEVTAAVKSRISVPFDKANEHLYEEVSVSCQVSAINMNDLVFARYSRVDCDRGTKACCQQCRVPDLAPEGIMDWRGHEEALAIAYTQRDSDKWLIENFFGKPRTCTPCQLHTIKGDSGAIWSAGAPEGEESQKVLEIVSSQQPPLSGEMSIDGVVYPNNKGLVILANKIIATDKKYVDLDKLKNRLLDLTPHKASHLKEIDDYLIRRELDISNHVTKIYGRHDIHLTMELVAHSALWMDYNGNKVRAWLDATIVGATRTGKSVTARRYLQCVGVGQHFVVMDNFSRAGLTMGAVQVNGQQRVRPGLFPRNHGRMVVLDEAHLMVSHQGEPVFPILQGARDVGRVDGAKVYGSQTLPGAVRLVTIANWLDGSKHSFAFPCEHFLRLYGSPEAMSRLDFGIIVDESDDEQGPSEVAHEWNKELLQATLLRAWNMDSKSIHVDDDAIRLAVTYCQEEWAHRFNEGFPLFTRKEKPISVVRIAIAIANLTMSHVTGDLSTCHVRKVHVEWAAQWLEHTWEQTGYDNYSSTTFASEKLDNPIKAEAQLIVPLEIKDPRHAVTTLSAMIGVRNRDELRNYCGMEYQAFERWLTHCIRSGVFEIARTGEYGSKVRIKPTKGGDELIRKLVHLSSGFPESWHPRFRQMEMWFRSGCQDSNRPKVTPLDTPLNLLTNEWIRCDSSQDLGQEPIPMG
jgi:hypothetical protein